VITRLSGGSEDLLHDHASGGSAIPNFRRWRRVIREIRIAERDNARVRSLSKEILRLDFQPSELIAWVVRALDDACDKSLARRVPFVRIENAMRDLELRGVPQNSESRAWWRTRSRNANLPAAVCAWPRPAP
jgi:hypothetical protein